MKYFNSNSTELIAEYGAQPINCVVYPPPEGKYLCAVLPSQITILYSQEELDRVRCKALGYLLIDKSVVEANKQL